MRSFINLGKTLSVVAFIAIVAGCGSSDDGGGAAGDSDVTYSGTFIDSAVTGLSYQCVESGLSGKTDADGKFSYKGGDRCTFSVGDVVLGDTAPSAIVTPLDLLSAYTYDEIVNILRFLQTLDMDSDLEGIQLPDNFTGTFEESGFNIDIDTFEAVFGELLASNSLDDLAIVGEEEAQEHFYGSTTPFFQAVLTEDMFNDKIMTWENGEQIILQSDATYELMTSDNGTAEVCLGSWNISDKKLMLSQETCDGAVQVNAIELDFISTPAAENFFRVKIGASVPYEYGFVRIESMGDAAVPEVAPVISAGFTLPAENSVSIIWNKIEKATGYSLIYNTTGDFSQLVIAEFYGPNVTGQILTGLNAGTTYYFQMHSRNIVGTSVASEIYSVSTLQAAPTTAPTAPSGLSYKKSSSSTLLNWNDNSDNEEKFILQIYDRPFNVKGGNLVEEDLAANTTSKSIVNPPEGTGTIYIRIKATNAIGSSYSNDINIDY